MKKKAKKARKKAAGRIPDFDSDQEAAEFFDAHGLEGFTEDLVEAPDVYFERPRKQVVTLRLDRPLVQRIKAAAMKKGIPYSTLIRMWLVERLEKTS